MLIYNCLRFQYIHTLDKLFYLRRPIYLFFWGTSVKGVLLDVSPELSGFEVVEVDGETSIIR